jgi:hypothetical protein
MPSTINENKHEGTKEFSLGHFKKKFYLEACKLPLISGNLDCGLKPTLKWYYDINKGGCYQFVYYGCEGNLY